MRKDEQQRAEGDTAPVRYDEYGCSAPGCREGATESRAIVQNGATITSYYCHAHAAQYDAELAKVNAENAERDKRWGIHMCDDSEDEAA